MGTSTSGRAGSPPTRPPGSWPWAPTARPPTPTFLVAGHAAGPAARSGARAQAQRALARALFGPQSAASLPPPLCTRIVAVRSIPECIEAGYPAGAHAHAHARRANPLGSPGPAHDPCIVHRTTLDDTPWARFRTARQTLVVMAFSACPPHSLVYALVAAPGAETVAAMLRLAIEQRLPLRELVRQAHPAPTLASEIGRICSTVAAQLMAPPTRRFLAASFGLIPDPHARPCSGFSTPGGTPRAGPAAAHGLAHGARRPRPLGASSASSPSHHIQPALSTSPTGA